MLYTYCIVDEFSAGRPFFGSYLLERPSYLYLLIMRSAMVILFFFLELSSLVAGVGLGESFSIVVFSAVAEVIVEGEEERGQEVECDGELTEPEEEEDPLSILSHDKIAATASAEEGELLSGGSEISLLSESTVNRIVNEAHEVEQGKMVNTGEGDEILATTLAPPGTKKRGSKIRGVSMKYENAAVPLPAVPERFRRSYRAGARTSLRIMNTARNSVAVEGESAAALNSLVRNGSSLSNITTSTNKTISVPTNLIQKDTEVDVILRFKAVSLNAIEQGQSLLDLNLSLVLSTKYESTSMPDAAHRKIPLQFNEQGNFSIPNQTLLTACITPTLRDIHFAIVVEGVKQGKQFPEKISASTCIASGSLDPASIPSLGANSATEAPVALMGSFASAGISLMVVITVVNWSPSMKVEKSMWYKSSRARESSAAKINIGRRPTVAERNEGEASEDGGEGTKSGEDKSRDLSSKGAPPKGKLFSQMKKSVSRADLPKLKPKGESKEVHNQNVMVQVIDPSTGDVLGFVNAISSGAFVVDPNAKSPPMNMSYVFEHSTKEKKVQGQPHAVATLKSLKTSKYMARPYVGQKMMARPRVQDFSYVDASVSGTWYMFRQGFKDPAEIVLLCGSKSLAFKGADERYDSASLRATKRIKFNLVKVAPQVVTKLCHLRSSRAIHDGNKYDSGRGASLRDNSRMFTTEELPEPEPKRSGTVSSSSLSSIQTTIIRERTIAESALASKEVEPSAEVPVETKAISRRCKVVLGKNGSIVGGSVTDLLVSLVFHPNEHDRIFDTEVFLQTYLSFTTVRDLMGVIRDLFRDRKRYLLEEGDEELLMLRLCSFCKMWVSRFWEGFDVGDVPTLIQFVENDMSQISSLGKAPKEALIRSMQRLGKKLEIDRRSTLATLEIPRQIGGEGLSLSASVNAALSLSLANITPSDLAKADSLISHKIFSQIKPVECFNMAWMGEEGYTQAPNIKYMIERFNRCSRWIVMQILNDGSDSTSARARLIEKVILCMNECIQMNNYQGGLTLYSALTHAAVDRLKASWARVDRKRMKDFRFAEELYSSKQNWKSYRSAVDDCVPPAVPYLGLYLTDLTFVEEGNSDLLDVGNKSEKKEGEVAASGDKRNSVINFAKRRLWATILRSLQMFQTVKYMCTSPLNLEENLWTMRMLSEDDCYVLSLQAEPRKSGTGSNTDTHKRPRKTKRSSTLMAPLPSGLSASGSGVGSGFLSPTRSRKSTTTTLMGRLRASTSKASERSVLDTMSPRNFGKDSEDSDGGKVARSKSNERSEREPSVRFNAADDDSANWGKRYTPREEGTQGDPQSSDVREAGEESGAESCFSGDESSSKTKRGRSFTIGQHSKVVNLEGRADEEQPTPGSPLSRPCSTTPTKNGDLAPDDERQKQPRFPPATPALPQQPPPSAMKRAGSLATLPSRSVNAGSSSSPRLRTGTLRTLSPRGSPRSPRVTVVRVASRKLPSVSPPTLENSEGSEEGNQGLAKSKLSMSATTLPAACVRVQEQEDEDITGSENNSTEVSPRTHQTSDSTSATSTPPRDEGDSTEDESVGDCSLENAGLAGSEYIEQRLRAGESNTDTDSTENPETSVFTPLLLAGKRDPQSYQDISGTASVFLTDVVRNSIEILNSSTPVDLAQLVRMLKTVRVEKVSTQMVKSWNDVVSTLQSLSEDKEFEDSSVLRKTVAAELSKSLWESVLLLRDQWGDECCARGGSINRSVLECQKQTVETAQSTIQAIITQIRNIKMERSHPSQAVRMRLLASLCECSEQVRYLCALSRHDTGQIANTLHQWLPRHLHAATALIAEGASYCRVFDLQIAPAIQADGKERLSAVTQTLSELKFFVDLCHSAYVGGVCPSPSAIPSSPISVQRTQEVSALQSVIAELGKAAELCKKEFHEYRDSPLGSVHEGGVQHITALSNAVARMVQEIAVEINAPSTSTRAESIQLCHERLAVCLEHMAIVWEMPYVTLVASAQLIAGEKQVIGLPCEWARLLLSYLSRSLQLGKKNNTFIYSDKISYILSRNTLVILLDKNQSAFLKQVAVNQRVGSIEGVRE